MPRGAKVEHEIIDYGDKSIGLGMDQDMSITTGQQLGFRSRGYRGVYLSGQEARVRRYHEVIDEYLQGVRPARPAERPGRRRSGRSSGRPQRQGGRRHRRQPRHWQGHCPCVWRAGRHGLCHGAHQRGWRTHHRHTTARMVSEAGGEGRAIRCDHGDDAAIAELFAQIGDEAGRIDFLINNVYKIPDPPAWGGGFWDHPIQIWDDQVGIGLRAPTMSLVGTPAPLLFKAASGAAIVNVFLSRRPEVPLLLLLWHRQGRLGPAHCGHGSGARAQGRGGGGALPRGSVSTEFIQDAAAARGMDLSKSQTPLFVGRSVTALLASGDLLTRTGSIQWVEDLAEEFDLGG